MKKSSLEKVPAEALKFHFAGESVCEFADSEESGKIPVRIKARSRGAISHWYWGQVVHDMAGMKLSKPRLPLDYCHREDEILGAADKFDVETGDLVVAGFLDGADETVVKVQRKAKLGVPYEASIFFDPRTVEAERLSENETAEVNGARVRGPVTIIRKWTLRGVALCPYGYDPKTSTRFSDNSGGDVEVTVLAEHPDQGGSTMPVDQKTPDEGTLSQTSQPATSQKPATPADQAPIAAGQQSQPPEKTGEQTEAAKVTAPIAAGEQSQKPAETPAPVPKAAPGQAFIDRFGLEKGAVYFAQGLSMDEAAAKHVAAVEKENGELKAKIAAAGLGSTEPVSFGGSREPDKKSAAIGDENCAKFCGAIKLPGKPA